MKYRHLLISIILFLIGFFFVESVYAAAFQLYELGTPIIGTAGVGQAAVANDASTAYFNPAGMALLPSSEIMIGSQGALPYTNFQANGANTIPGNNGGNAGTIAPGVDFFYVYSMTPKLKLGVSLTTPYYGSLDYNNGWVGRYEVQQIYFYALDLNPVISYRLTDWASIGGGFTIEYANLNETVAVPIIPDILDGQAAFKVDNTSSGFNLGVLLQPTKMTKVGVAYRSQIIHHLNGDVSFANLAGVPNASTKMVMPSNVIASIMQQITDKFALLGELGWADWSSMRDNVIFIKDVTIVIPQNWHNTYRVGLAGQYQFTPAFLFELGGSYDSSPTTSDARTAELPMDRQLRLGTGITYAILKPVKLGLSYEYINLGKASIDNASADGVFSGKYSRNFTNIFQLSLNVAMG